MPVVRYGDGQLTINQLTTDSRMRKVYLDHSATTPVDRRVVEAMLPYLTEKFGNASSVHLFGQEARAAADRARRQVAGLIGARANEIVFTSGGTEANNLAIRGVCELAESHGRHIIASSIEHPSVRGAIESLEKRGWSVSRLPVYEDGIVRTEDVRSALRAETILISVMMANNEIGTIQPIKEIGELINEERQRGHRYLWFHSDALLSISAHKIYAPKGTGALFLRRGVRLTPQLVGGHQERERRAGTEPIANIVAFGAAAELASREMTERNEHTRHLRDRFERAVAESIDDIALNGDRERRLPHLSNISFRFIEGEGLLIHLDMQGVAVSTGSACSSGTLEPSPVIRALGRDEELARGAIRFSFGKDNTDDDIDYALPALQDAVASLRKLSPLSRQTVAAS